MSGREKYLMEHVPRVLWVCGRDFCRGPFHYEVGAYWGRDFGAGEGDRVYRKAFVLRWHWRLDCGARIDRS